MPSNQARKPQKSTTWSKLKTLFSGDSSTQSAKQKGASSKEAHGGPRPQGDYRYVDQDTPRAAKPRSTEPPKRPTDHSKSKRQDAGRPEKHHRAEARKETNAFLAAGTHLQQPAQAATRQRSPVDSRRKPTPDNGSRHGEAFNSDRTTQGRGNNDYQTPLDQVKPAERLVKKDPSRDISTKKLRKVNERKPAVTHQEPRRHVSTQVMRNTPTPPPKSVSPLTSGFRPATDLGPVSPVTPGFQPKDSRPPSPLTPGNRGTKRDYSTNAQPVPPVPTVPESARRHKSRERSTQKKTTAPPPNAAAVYEHRQEVGRSRKPPNCYMCGRDSVYDLQVERSVPNKPLCKACIKGSFVNLQPNLAYQARPDSPTLANQPAVRHERPSHRHQQPSAGHYVDSSDMDPSQAAYACSPPTHRSNSEKPKKPQRYQASGANFNTPWYYSPTPSPAPSPAPPQRSPTPSRHNPLNPSYHHSPNSEGRLVHTYSTVFARQKAQPAPPLATMPSNVHQHSHNSTRRPSSVYSDDIDPSYRLSQCLGGGMLPPNAFNPEPSPPLLPPVKRHSPLPVPSDSPRLPGEYRPIRWRTEQKVKRKPVPESAYETRGQGRY